MIKLNDHQSKYLFSPWSYLGQKRLKLLQESWAGLFREEILNELPVEAVAKYYHASFGRPTKELYTMVGAVVLQQVLDLTDEEAMMKMAFDAQWHYALDITEETDAAKYMSLKTLWNFRTLMVKEEIDVEIFAIIADKLARIFKVDTEKQRLDSVHIRSNMKRLGRISIFARSMQCFLKNLKRHHGEEFGLVPGEIIGRYLSDKAVGCFSMVKPSESEKTLSVVSRDLYELTELFKDTEKVVRMNSYQIMVRVLAEQCTVKESSETEPVEVKVKPPREISSDSLQNPSDSDASYDGHKGQGYQVQLMETYQREKNGEKGLNLVTHVEVERAHESDANALIPALESVKERELAPEEVLADSLYGSDENVEKAKEMEIDVVSPVIGRKGEDEEKLSINDFEKDKSGQIIRCPVGKEPKKVRNSGDQHTLIFDGNICAGCPLFDKCPAKKGKRGYYLHYNDKQMRLAQRRAEEKTEEFKDRYRYRAGVEGTISAFDRLTGVKRLRVRGLAAVRFCAVLKAVGVNIFRAAAFRKRETLDKMYNCSDTFFVFKAILALKNLISMKIVDFEEFIDWRLKNFNFTLQNAG